MSWNVNGCDRPAAVQNVFGPKKRLERKRWRWENDQSRRTPQRVAVPGVLGLKRTTPTPTTPHHRVSVGAVTSRSSRLQGAPTCRRVSLSPSPVRQEGQVAGCSVSHPFRSGVISGGGVRELGPTLPPPLLLVQAKLLTPHCFFLDLKNGKPARGGRTRVFTDDAPLLPPPGRSHFLTACR